MSQAALFSGMPRFSLGQFGQQSRLLRDRTRVVVGALVVEELAFFDHFRHGTWNHRFPGWIALADLLENVAREDAEAFRVVVVQVADPVSFYQIAEQLLKFRFDVEGLAGQQLVRLTILQRIAVDLQVVLEQTTKRFQDTAVEFEVILFVEQFPQAGSTHHHADVLVGASSEVGAQAVVLEVIGDQHIHAAGRHHVSTR